ncbi:MAG: hypothetical protein JW717_00575 [Marinilabiliaceae bacterium]|nr:hypothetical protein [Marinilabiliaceae bacterium]
MIKIYQVNSTLLVSFEKNDNLGIIDLRNLIKEMILKLKSPFSNILIDLKGISEIDEKGLRLLELGKKISEMHQSQISIFNANGNLLTQIKENRLYLSFFFCDHLSLAS